MGYRRIGEGINNVLLTLDLVLKIKYNEASYKSFSYAERRRIVFIFTPRPYNKEEDLCARIGHESNFLRQC